MNYNNKATEMVQPFRERIKIFSTNIKFILIKGYFTKTNYLRFTKGNK
jgi:hypothetical protein